MVGDSDVRAPTSDVFLMDDGVPTTVCREVIGGAELSGEGGAHDEGFIGEERSASEAGEQGDGHATDDDTRQCQSEEAAETADLSADEGGASVEEDHWDLQEGTQAREGCGGKRQLRRFHGEGEPNAGDGPTDDDELSREHSGPRQGTLLKTMPLVPRTVPNLGGGAGCSGSVATGSAKYTSSATEAEGRKRKRGNLAQLMGKENRFARKAAGTSSEQLRPNGFQGGELKRRKLKQLNQSACRKEALAQDRGKADVTRSKFQRAGKPGR